MRALLTASLASNRFPVGPKFTNVPAFCDPLPPPPADPDGPGPEALALPGEGLTLELRALLEGNRSGTGTGFDSAAALPSNRRPVPAKAKNLGSSGSGAGAGPAVPPTLPSAAAGAVVVPAAVPAAAGPTVDPKTPCIGNWLKRAHVNQIITEKDGVKRNLICSCNWGFYCGEKYSRKVGKVRSCKGMKYRGVRGRAQEGEAPARPAEAEGRSHCSNNLLECFP